MKKIIGIVGSGRKNSNSKRLLQVALDAAQKKGFETKLIDVLDLKFVGCNECNECKRLGRCVIEDDLTPLYDEIELADGVIVAAPVYFYSLPGQIKLFVDRFQALWARYTILKQKYRHRGYGGVISIAGSRGNRVFDGVVLPLKYFFEVQGKKMFEPLLFRDYDGDPDKLPPTFLLKVQMWTQRFLMMVESGK